jgi:hypothetical protein
LSWKGSGWFTKTMATSLGYFFSISFTVGVTRPQNGHWKSLNSTTVTLAALGPRRGAPAGMATFLGPAGGGGADGAAAAPLPLFSRSR